MSKHLLNEEQKGGNIFLLLFVRLLLVFFFYTLARLLFYAYNYDILGIDSWATFLEIMKGGLVFDASAIGYTNGLIILLHLLPLRQRMTAGYQRLIKWLYFAINIPFLMMNLGDIIYFRFTGKRTTVAIFDEFANESFGDFLYFFLEYWHLTLIGIVLILLWFYLYPNRNRWTFPIRRLSNIIYYPLSLVAIALTAGLTIIGIRGGVSAALQPIKAGDALVYTDNAMQASMVLNTPFTMLRLIGKQDFPKYNYMPQEEAEKVFSPIRLAGGEEATPFTGKFKGRNVVFLIWESCAKQWVGELNRDIPNFKTDTPFLDSLIRQSYVFEQAYANGTKSVDAMPAIFASLPKPMLSFVLSHYATDKLNSILPYLKAQGYYSAYFHNATKGSMGFDAMAQHLGFEDYFGRENFEAIYGDDAEWFDGKWGIWDEPFLQYMLSELNKMKEPFIVSEFTTSSHNPFVLPKEYEKRFPEDKECGYRQVMPYTDYALERFFQEAKKQKWYKNTLFVILADHAVYPYVDEYKTSLGAYRIPILFFDPRGELIGRDRETVVQQADILPSLMDLMGIKEPIISFGQNMFNPKEEHFAITTMNEAFQLIKGDYALQFNGQETIALYNYKEDPMCKQNLKGQGLEAEGKLTKLMQAILQELSHRLRNDRLTYEKIR